MDMIQKQWHGKEVTYFTDKELLLVVEGGDYYLYHAFWTGTYKGMDVTTAGYSGMRNLKIHFGLTNA